MQKSDVPASSDDVVVAFGVPLEDGVSVIAVPSTLWVPASFSAMTAAPLQVQVPLRNVHCAKTPDGPTSAVWRFSRVHASDALRLRKEFAQASSNDSVTETLRLPLTA